jgi:predicted O-methyltransferase YrrM
MLKLSDIVDNTRTDKNTEHSYLDLYDTIMSSKKDSATNILEIGIAQGGGSIKLWNDYFLNANIYGLDIISKDMIWRELYNLERVTLHSSINAYDTNTIRNIFPDETKKFDIVIDDGPHSLQSMIYFIKIFTPLLKDDGILIIEDVQDYEWLQILYDVVPNQLKKFVKTYDLRKNKGRYDDIVFTINKSTI